MKTVNTSHESIVWQYKENWRCTGKKKDVAYNKLLKQQAHLVS